MSAGGDGLERLLSAVFEGDDPAPELLAAYVRDPGSLPAETRREIERALAERPDLADEVRTLRSFEVPSLAEPVVRAPAVRSRWRRVAFWVGAAAAALLLLALTPQARRWLGGPERALPAPSEQAALPPGPPPPEPPPAPAPPPAPERPPVIASNPPAPEEPAPPQRAEAPRPAEPALEPPPEPQMADAPVEPAPPAQDPGPIAMVEPSYRRPAEALDRRRVVVAMRGPTDEAVEPVALAPEHVALTGSPAPDLFWKLSGAPPEGAAVLFRLVEERSGETVLEIPLALPGGPGLQRVRLAEQAATLSPGVVYTWYVVLRTDPENPARDALAQGWIQRREGDGAAAADPGAVAAELARAGLWYDALAATLDLRARQPDNESVARGLRALLAQAGVAAEL